VKLRFLLTQGRDPIFSPVDGTNCGELEGKSTLSARRKASSLLLEHGLIRIPLALPANAEFDVVNVSNRYGCNDFATLSMYRRPIPTSNLRFQSAIMWDGRESAPQTGTQKITYATNPSDLLANLAHQAMDATTIHAQGATPLSAAQQKQIVDFEMSLITAQAYDYQAGSLRAAGANGGPKAIVEHTLLEFFIGVNDPLGGNPHGTAFTPVIFNLFDAWNALSGGRWWDARDRRRASIARGQTLFNSKPISIVNVAGLNDDLNQPVIAGTCGTCHDSPNIGNHSLPVPLNIGVGDVDSPLDVSYLPVFTLRNKMTGDIKTTTDPGRAMISGAWKDVGRLKGPVLHGLSSRAPYFHNGSARTLADVIDFYNKHFNVGFTEQEKEDLVAFLSSL